MRRRGRIGEAESVKKLSKAAIVLAPALILAEAQAAAAETEESQQLSTLSIEELARLTVRSASKQDEPLNTVPTALYVITGEEILASPALSIP